LDVQGARMKKGPADWFGMLVFSRLLFALGVRHAAA
jgi:hypothetical protein